MGSQFWEQSSCCQVALDALAFAFSANVVEQAAQSRSENQTYSDQDGLSPKALSTAVFGQCQQKENHAASMVCPYLHEAFDSAPGHAGDPGLGMLRSAGAMQSRECMASSILGAAEADQDSKHTSLALKMCGCSA